MFLQSGSILEPQQLSQGVSNHVKLQSEVNELPKLPLALTSALNYQLGASWVSMPERLLLKSAVGLVLNLNVIFELILKHCQNIFFIKLTYMITPNRWKISCHINMLAS